MMKSLVNNLLESYDRCYQQSRLCHPKSEGWVVHQEDQLSGGHPHHRLVFVHLLVIFHSLIPVVEGVVA